MLYRPAVYLCPYSVCSSDNTSSVSWYSPSRRPLPRQPESPFNSRYEDYDYACSYGDRLPAPSKRRLPAPSPVYSRQNYVQRSLLSNQCDWYARGDGDGHFEPDRFQDNSLQAPDGRSPYRQYDEPVSRSRDPVSGYYEADGRFLDGGSFSYGGTTTSRFADGQTRRNGGIGYDWTSATPDRKSANRELPNRKSANQKSPDQKSANRKLPNRKSATRKSPDRKSGYHDDSLLIIGDTEIYSGDDRSPFDYNIGTVQRRVGKGATSPYPDELRSVDGMERRLPVGTESVSESPYRKEKDRAQRESPHRGGSFSTAGTGKNGSRSRTKVDDIQRLTERDRVPAAQSRKQQNHVTPRGERAPSPRVEESTKQSRSRGHKSSTTAASTTSG